MNQITICGVPSTLYSINHGTLKAEEYAAHVLTSHFEKINDQPFIGGSGVIELLVDSAMKAPDSFQWQFCAPSFTFEPSMAFFAKKRSTKGGQITTSHFAPSIAAIASARVAASEGVLFIFQFPAMMVFLIVFPLFFFQASNTGKFFSFQEFKACTAAG